jgi:MoxR-like ATPase
VCVGLGYPDVDAERAILTTHSVRQHLVDVPAVASLKDVVAVQEAVDRVTVSPAVLDYVLAFVRATRTDPLFEIGVSPRCSIDLLKTARAWALLQGRRYVVPDDVKKMAAYVVPHRIVRRGGHKGASAADIEQVFERVPAPV